MRFKDFLHEMKHHVPFTFFATLGAILLIIVLKYIFEQQIPKVLFELSHVLHIIVSSAVTAGIYYKYKKNVIFSLIVGVFGAIIIGSLSDIVFPWMGGVFLGLHMHFHLPVVEFPIIVLGAALAGSVIGMKTIATRMPHFVHVFLSVFASLFYLLTFSAAFEFSYFTGAFLIVFGSVIIPCCISDILFPFFFIGKKEGTCVTGKCKSSSDK